MNFEVPYHFYTKAHCFPVLASPGFYDPLIGGCFGTLSVFLYHKKVVVVTALHVLDDCMHTIFNYRGAKRIYSPLLPKWQCVDLTKYNWRQITHPNDNESTSYLDLAYAVLTKSQMREIDPERIRFAASATDLRGDFFGVLQGYPGSKNTMAKNRSREGAHLLSVSLESRLVPLAPFVKKTFSEFGYFKYESAHNDVWCDTQHYESNEIFPSLSGVSGGPIFYCQHTSGETIHEPKIIGFFLEYCRREKIGKYILSDVLLQAIDVESSITV